MYLYSQSLACVLYIHPLIGYYYLADHNLYQVFSFDSNNYSNEEQTYYWKKYQFYKTHKVFDQVDKDNMLIADINAEMVKSSVENTEQIAIELIQDCNLNCTYCIYGELYNNPFQYHRINVEYLKKIITHLVDVWNKQNCIKPKDIRINYYGGEPLIMFDSIVAITNYIKSLATDNVKFNFGLTTNGTLLNKEKIDFFAQNNFDIAISLDGDKQSNVYRKYKNGFPVYQKVYDNLESIRRTNPDYFKSKIHFISVVHDKNSNFDIRGFFMKEFGIDKIYLGTLNRIGVNQNKTALFDAIYRYNNYDDDIIVNGNTYRLYKELDKLSKNYPFPKEVKKVNRLRLYTGTCLPLSKKLFITAEYILMPCEKIDFDVNFGRIYNGGKIEIDYQAIAEQHNKNINNVIRQCKKCYYSELCSFCIYTMKTNSEGLYYCDKFMNRETYQQYLSQLWNCLENIYS